MRLKITEAEVGKNNSFQPNFKLNKCMIKIEYFKGIPIEYESFLIERYNSFITTCRYIEVYYSSFDINYMVVYNDNVMIDLLVFGNKDGTATCFNSLVNIDQRVVSAFTIKIFENFPSIQKMKIVASYTDYTSQKAILYSKTDDSILNLPSAMDDFYLMLGSSTRQHIRSRRGKLLRDYPSINYVTKFGVDIEESNIDKIIQLNGERMKHKGIIPGIDNTYRKNIYKYSQHYGCVTYIEIDGLVVAGCIATILEKGMFLHVFAHDENYSKYNIGEACVCYLIQTAIEKGIPTFHFLWGESELKKRLLGKPFPLYSYFIFRDYSIYYVLSKINIYISTLMVRLQRSEMLKPVKKAVKFYRKSKWRA